MKNILTLILTILLFGCQEKTTKNNELIIESEKIIDTAKTKSQLSEYKNIKNKESHKYYSLKDISKKVNSGCLVIEKLYNIILNNSPYDNSIDKTELPILYGREITDSVQFDKAHVLKPLCRVYSNKDIDVIAFTDVYDYKNAIHLFTFDKITYSPLSSFILYSFGGDANDFWKITPKQKDSLIFELTNEIGFVNDVETRDTIHIKSRDITLITINSLNGNLSKKVLSSDVDLIETKKANLLNIK